MTDDGRLTTKEICEDLDRVGNGGQLRRQIVNSAIERIEELEEQLTEAREEAERMRDSDWWNSDSMQPVLIWHPLPWEEAYTWSEEQKAEYRAAEKANMARMYTR